MMWETLVVYHQLYRRRYLYRIIVIIDVNSGALM